MGSEKSIFRELLWQTATDPHQIRYTCTLHRSRGDNSQKIFGAIGEAEVKWRGEGGSDTPVKPEFFWPVNQMVFRQLLNGRFSLNVAKTREAMSLEICRKEFSKNVPFRGHSTEGQWLVNQVKGTTSLLLLPVTCLLYSLKLLLHTS